MPLLARKKSTGEFFPDFQSNAAPGTLLANAVRAGFAAAENLEEVTVSDADYSAAERAAYDATRAANAAANTTLRNQVVTVAQSAVGIRIDNLTAAQVRGLVAILLWQAGALDNSGNVRPLAQWVNG